MSGRGFPNRKKRRGQGKQKSEDGSVNSKRSCSSNFSSASNGKFIDSKGNVKIAKLPLRFVGKTDEQVALALLENPTSSEAVTAIILSANSKSEFRSRCADEFIAKAHDKKMAESHLGNLQSELGAHGANALRYNNEHSVLQAKILSNTSTVYHLKGQKEEFQTKLAEGDDFVAVRKAILALFDLLDPLSVKYTAPFKDLALKTVATQLGITTWDEISDQTFNASHRAILVCDALGLSGNEHFKAVWGKDSLSSAWYLLFGSEPSIRTGRADGALATKVRLAVYIGVEPSDKAWQNVLGPFDASDSASDLSDILEEPDDEAEDEEWASASGVPEDIHVGGKKRSRPSSLKDATNDELEEQMKKMQEEMKRRSKAAGGD